MQTPRIGKTQHLYTTFIPFPGLGGTKSRPPLLPAPQPNPPQPTNPVPKPQCPGGRDYNKRLCQNFRLCPKNPQDLLNRISYDEDSNLTLDIVSEFQTVLSLYIDFLQKEKFNKLKKLRQSQANLPIAEFRQEIVKTLGENQVVIIAGDTGCGKSRLQLYSS